MKSLILLLPLALLSESLAVQTAQPTAPATVSYQTGAPESDLESAMKSTPTSLVCDALRISSKSEKMAFETGEISPVCKPFVKYARKDLDRCGDLRKDPYTANSSSFTWASRADMWKKGKTNIFTDRELRAQVPTLTHHIEEMKSSAAELCCGTDTSCKQAFEKVDISFCRPQTDPNTPDPCVFGGSYKMAGEGYTSVFQAIEHSYGEEQSGEFKKIAERNLAADELHEASGGLRSGRIVLSSYVSRAEGPASLDPVVLHELGHACSMIRMEQWSLTGTREALKQVAKPAPVQDRALRAAKWLDSARSRCSPELALPEAYNDFWSALGEGPGLAQCLYKLTIANQKQQVDRPCPGLCPGHYLEESVGIAFSLLLGAVSTTPNEVGAVFPNTCDHVRDGQHPMVSDVADCLAQNSPRFREKIKTAYRCASN